MRYEDAHQESIGLFFSVSFGLIIACYYFSWRIKTKCKSSSPTSHKSNSQRCDPCKEGTMFIIDGCNGPIRLDSPSKDLTKDTKVSLLHVQNGRNIGDRIDLLSHLDKTLDHHAFINNAIIFFDGIGMKAIANKSWKYNPWIEIKITKEFVEVDNHIVDIVMERSKERTNDSTNQSNVRDLKECLQDTNEDCIDNFDETVAVYSIARNDQGAGKKRYLKDLCLLRPNSVYCAYSIKKSSTPTAFSKKEYSNLRQMVESGVDSLIDKIYKTELTSETRNQTIVVTDDILLRQRIVDSGGFVMTFEQLWLFLQ